MNRKNITGGACRQPGWLGLCRISQSAANINVKLLRARLFSEIGMFKTMSQQKTRKTTTSKTNPSIMNKLTFCWFLGGFKYHFHFPNHSFSHGPMGQRWFFIRSNAGPALPPGPWKDPPPPDPQLPPGPGNGKSQKIAAMFCWRSPNF